MYHLAQIPSQYLGTNDIPTLGGLEYIFSRIIAAAIALTGIVLFIFLLKGGMSYITSGGSPDKAAGARNAITYAILGVVFVAMAYLILRTIAVLTGANSILIFKIVQ